MIRFFTGRPGVVSRLRRAAPGSALAPSGRLHLPGRSTPFVSLTQSSGMDELAHPFPRRGGDRVAIPDAT